MTKVAEVAKADIRVEVNQDFLNSGHYAASHVAVAAVEAGIECSSIDEENIRYDETEQSYFLSLPPPILTSCRIEYIAQYDGSLTLLAADWDVIRQLAQVDALEYFTQDLIENGFLETASEESTIRVQEFVSALTGKPTVTEYQDSGDDIRLPQSCIPEPPPGWRKKEGSNGWEKFEG